MATTTNFGWETPDDTDLVKDGALAMRTLGNAIDASLVDLKGGTTGQVLAKASNTDLDFVWSADAAGISPTIFDAKGDLIAATAADTAARLAVGANGTVLTADSAAATGLKWASVSTPSFVGVSLSNTTDTTLSNNVYTVLNWNSELFDTDGFHSTSSNTSRITIPAGKAGKYLVIGNVLWNGNTTGERTVMINKNGNEAYYTRIPAQSIFPNTRALAVMNLAVGDYLTLSVFQNSGGSLTLYQSTTFVEFSASYLGA